MSVRAYVLLILLPPGIIGGYVLASMLPGFLGSLYDDFAGPFLIMTWIGLGFSNVWDYIWHSLHEDAPDPDEHGPSTAFAVVAGLALLGGLFMLPEDPWMFGIVIAPGVRLAWPWLARRLGTPAPPGGGAGP